MCETVSLFKVSCAIECSHRSDIFTGYLGLGHEKREGRFRILPPTGNNFAGCAMGRILSSKGEP